MGTNKNWVDISTNGQRTLDGYEPSFWTSPLSLNIWTTLVYTPKQHATNCSHSGPSRNLILFAVEYSIVFWSILMWQRGRERERNKFNTRIDIRKVSMLIGLQFDNHSNHYITATAAATAVKRRREEKVNTWITKFRYLALLLRCIAKTASSHVNIFCTKLVIFRD